MQLPEIKPDVAQHLQYILYRYLGQVGVRISCKGNDD